MYSSNNVFVDFVASNFSGGQLAQTGDSLGWLFFILALFFALAVVFMKAFVFTGTKLEDMSNLTKKKTLLVLIVFVIFALCVMFSFSFKAFANDKTNDCAIHIEVDVNTGEYKVDDGVLNVESTSILQNFNVEYSSESIKDLGLSFTVNNLDISNGQSLNMQNTVSCKIGNLSFETAKQLIGQKVATLNLNSKLTSMDTLKAETITSANYNQKTYVNSRELDFDIRKADIEENGYKCSATNNLNGSLFATYLKDNTMKHIYFTPNNEIREVTIKNGLMPPQDAGEYKKICEETVSIVKIDGSSDSLCCVYRLCDGSFIILDSNVRNKDQSIPSCTKQIYECLASLAPDSTNINIRMWYFSHVHKDHIGGFLEYCDFKDQIPEYQNIHIQSFAYNFASSEEQYKHVPNSLQMYNLFEEKIKAYYPNTPTYTVLPGQQYYFPGARFDVLYAYSDFIPSVFGEESDDPEVKEQADLGRADGNLESALVKITSEETGKTFLCTADVGEYNLKDIVKRYDSSVLKSDIMTIPHHGHDEDFYRARNGNRQFYDYINPTVILFPVLPKNFNIRNHATKDQYYEKHHYVSFTQTEYIYQKCINDCYVSGYDTYTISMKTLKSIS